MPIECAAVVQAETVPKLPPVPGGDTPYLQVQNYSLAALAKRDAGDPFAKPAPVAADPPPADPPSDPEDDPQAKAEAAKAASKALAAFLIAQLEATDVGA